MKDIALQVGDYIWMSISGRGRSASVVVKVNPKSVKVVRNVKSRGQPNVVRLNGRFVDYFTSGCPDDYRVLDSAASALGF
jgi:hypothetical protein